MRPHRTRSHLVPPPRSAMVRPAPARLAPRPPAPVPQRPPPTVLRRAAPISPGPGPMPMSATSTRSGRPGQPRSAGRPRRGRARAGSCDWRDRSGGRASPPGPGSVAIRSAADTAADLRTAVASAAANACRVCRSCSVNVIGEKNRSRSSPTESPSASSGTVDRGSVGPSGATITTPVARAPTPPGRRT